MEWEEREEEKKGKRGETERDLPTADSFPECPHHLGLGQVQVRAKNSTQVTHGRDITHCQETQYPEIGIGTAEISILAFHYGMWVCPKDTDESLPPLFCLDYY